MRKLFLQVDKHIARYQKRTRLACLKGCGRCCENPHVETTVSQVLPLAQHLFENGSIELAWQDLERSRSTSICAFYRPDPLMPGKGRCSQYALRPLICRLFGFSARHNKNGRIEVMTCELIKANDPQAVNNSQKLIDKGLKAPLMQDYTLRACGISPENNITMPINDAIEKAIEVVGLYQNFNRSAGE